MIGKINAFLSGITTDEAAEALLHDMLGRADVVAEVSGDEHFLELWAFGLNSPLKVYPTPVNLKAYEYWKELRE